MSEVINTDKQQKNPFDKGIDAIFNEKSSAKEKEYQAALKVAAEALNAFEAAKEKVDQIEVEMADIKNSKKDFISKFKA